jgi:DNA-binding CsgD family transcriptional regulator/PAS domain-containing protein
MEQRIMHAKLDTVISAIDSLLAGALDSEQLPVAIETMRTLFGGSKACFARFGPDMKSGDTIATNADETLEQRCYTDLAPDFAVMADVVSGDSARRCLSGPGRVRREQPALQPHVWQEWMAPQDMYGGIACRLLESGPSFWFFDVQRGRTQDAFDAADCALLERLFPVLRRVSEISRQVGHLRMQRDEARRALDTLALGIVIVDRDMRIVYANEGADEILADQEAAVGLRQGRLFARAAADQRQLKHLVEGALKAAADPLAEQRCSMIVQGIGNRTHPLSACVMPAAASSALADPHSSGHDCAPAAADGDRSGRLRPAQQLFGLTDAEARFASALASGQSLAEAAEDQGVRISTARTHLARIFQKTGTRQQSQVAALLRSAELPMRG